MFERIVVGVDGSTANDAVIETAAKLSASTGGALVVLHVLDVWPSRGAAHEESEAAARSLLDTVKTRIEDAGGKVAGTLFARPGARGAAWEICETAKAERADAIVVGSRGHGAWAGAVLGSVSQRVVHHAPCPVLIVPSPDS